MYLFLRSEQDALRPEGEQPSVLAGIGDLDSAWERIEMAREGSMSNAMSQSLGQHKTVNPYSACEHEPASSVPVLSERPLWVVMETIFVGAGTLTAIKAAMTIKHEGPFLWLLVPAILIAGALIPTWIGRRAFPRIGYDRNGIRVTVITVGCTCICVLPMVVLGLWLLQSWRLPIPLRPVIEGPQQWLAWSLYQCLYVAVSEEVFFRGYIQANAVRALARLRWLPRPARPWSAVLISAACFAVAHVVVQGQIISAVTFLPGVLLAWLFLRTRTLLAPVVFHGVANVSYGIMAAMILA